MWRLITVLAALFCMAMAQQAQALSVPERFEYELTWIGMVAGSSSLESTRDDAGNMVLVSNAQSTRWIDRFYPVRDHVESQAQGMHPWLPFKYLIQTREGKKEKHKEVLFGRNGEESQYIDHVAGEKESHKLPLKVYDPLSAFAIIRDSELVVGKSIFIPMFDSKRLYDVEVKVLRKEKIKVPAGSFDTIVVHPVMKTEGIFVSKGPIHIWLTDDARRLPVRLRADVPIGSIVANLTGGTW